MTRPLPQERTTADGVWSSPSSHCAVRTAGSPRPSKDQRLRPVGAESGRTASSPRAVTKSTARRRLSPPRGAVHTEFLEFLAFFGRSVDLHPSPILLVFFDLLAFLEFLAPLSVGVHPKSETVRHRTVGTTGGRPGASTGAPRFAHEAMKPVLSSSEPAKLQPVIFPCISVSSSDRRLRI